MWLNQCECGDKDLNANMPVGLRERGERNGVLVYVVLGLHNEKTIELWWETARYSLVLSSFNKTKAKLCSRILLREIVVMSLTHNIFEQNNILSNANLSLGVE